MTDQEDHNCEVCELATELAEERALMQRLLTAGQAMRDVLIDADTDEAHAKWNALDAWDALTKGDT